MDEPLCEAVRVGRLEAVQAAVEAGVHIDARTPTGATMLASAAWFGHVNLVSYLLESGADVHALKPTNGGETALDLARQAGSTAVALLLEQRGAPAKRTLCWNATSDGATTTTALTGLESALLEDAVLVDHAPDSRVGGSEQPVIFLDVEGVICPPPGCTHWLAAQRAWELPSATRTRARGPWRTRAGPRARRPSTRRGRRGGATSPFCAHPRPQ